MRIILSPNATAREVGEVLRLAREVSDNPGDVTTDTLDGRIFIALTPNGESADPAFFRALRGVDTVEDAEPLYRLAGLGEHPAGARATSRTVIEIPYAGASIGSDEFVVMAGPCAVEDERDLLLTARAAKRAGAKLLRGGAFKPRTSPYSFQGIGEKGLQMLGRVRDEVGIGIVTEAMEPAAVEMVGRVADIIQIGSRNMQNFPLLREVGRGDKPVLLKRGMSATLEEWLGAAEYVLGEGNPNVIFCERGIRTFSRHSRHTLDLGVVPVLRERTRLPVIVDPSHATGAASRVRAMALAAIASGADGLLIEIHPEPERALSDGFQALPFDEFDALMSDLGRMAEVVGRRL